MLIDSFTYFNEADILLFRLAVLSPFVDKFVIVESDYTFSGNKKPQHSVELIGKLWPYREKLIFHMHKADLTGLDFSKKPDKFDETQDCWNIEHQQRNAILDACVDLPADAKIMIGDVDEIPAPAAVKYVSTLPLGQPVVFSQWFFYYNLCHMRKQLWPGTIATTLGYMRETTPQELRDMRCMLPNRVANGGFHLSFFNTPQGIKKKIESFSHQELNKDEYTDIAHIGECIATGRDLFNRSAELMEIPKDAFPPYFREHAPKAWWG